MWRMDNSKSCTSLKTLSCIFVLFLGIVNSQFPLRRSYVRIKLNYIKDGNQVLFNSTCSVEECKKLRPYQVRLCVKLSQTEEYLEDEFCAPDYQLQAVFNTQSPTTLPSYFVLNKLRPGNLVIIIEVLDLSKNVLMGEELIARGVLGKRFHATESWRNVVFENEGDQTFAFSYVTLCKRSFYGKNCDKYCRDAVDRSYYCNEDGDRVCFNSFGGEKCEDVCSECCLKESCSNVMPCNCSVIIGNATENLIQ